MFTSTSTTVGEGIQGVAWCLPRALSTPPSLCCAEASVPRAIPLIITGVCEGSTRLYDWLVLYYVLEGLIG